MRTPRLVAQRFAWWPGVRLPPTAAGSPHRCCVALQDTVTGFLLAGVGNVDLRRKGNFLVVNESAGLARGARALRTEQQGVSGAGRGAAVRCAAAACGSVRAGSG